MVRSQKKAGEAPASYFLRLLDSYEEVVRSAGKRVYRSLPEDGARLFMALTEEHRHRLIARLEVELAIFEEAMANRESLKDSAKLAWRYFGLTGYKPSADIFGKIIDTDVVELYGLEQTHLFQNLNFFDWVSTTLEQLFCLPWYELSQRDPQIQGQLAEIAGSLFRGERTTTLYPGVPWHVVREMGAEAYEFDFHIKWLSPVYSCGRMAGIIAVCEAKSLRSLKTRKSVESAEIT